MTTGPWRAASMLLAVAGASCTVAPCPNGYVCTAAGATPVTADGAAPAPPADGAMPQPTALPPEPGPPWEDVTPPGIDLTEEAFGGANYGMQEVVAPPQRPGTVYLSTCYQGFWRSTDSGVTWTRVNTGRNGDALDRGRQWSLVVDPEDPDVLYTTSGYGALGIWKTANGGVDWDPLFTDDPVQNPTGPINGILDPVIPDISHIDIDPADPRHLIATFHDNAWNGYDGAGLVETRDGGATWILRPPPAGFGVAQCAYFLNDSDTWLVVSSAAGTWRTTDGGETWAQVSGNVHFGGCQLYRGQGALYVGSSSGLLRSDDNGATWDNVDDRRSDVQAVAGDGSYIYSSSGLLGFHEEPYNPTQRAPEVPGDRGWRTYGSDLFSNGAKRLALDRDGHVLYAAAWRAGAYRLVLE